MKNLLYLLCAVIVLSSCCTKKFAEKDATVIHDSIRTEVRTETVYVPDTIYVEIPAQSAERTTADSVSHLENDYAVSDARINTDGSLFHSLETKPQNMQVGFMKPVERNDSIVYRYKFRDVEVTKEKELSKWEQMKIDYGGKAIAVLVLIVLYILYRVIKRFTIR